jgi:hypothetical protein
MKTIKRKISDCKYIVTKQFRGLNHKSDPQRSRSTKIRANWRKIYTLRGKVNNKGRRRE